MISGIRAPAIQSRQPFDVGLRCHGFGRACARKAIVGPGAVHLLAQHLARQRKIDGAGRRRGGEFQCSIDDRDHLVAALHLVVPFHELTQHPRLVEHFLGPVDVDAARPRRTRLGKRRAAGGEQHRHAVTACVDQRVQGIRRADIDVQHDRLRPSGGQRVAVRHRHRRVLVRHDDRPRDAPIAALGPGERFDQGSEVGARIDEQVVDAVRPESVEIVLRGDPTLSARIHFRPQPPKRRRR